MENSFDSLIKLLNNALSSDDVSNLNDLEKEIQVLASKISSQLGSDDNNLEITEENLNQLKDLIDKISNKNEKNKDYLLEFKEFLDNRKIK
tara:strand:+ start:409 stop:681 length:273 start_codon:yes stop_codon:yes gene_type:complete